MHKQLPALIGITLSCFLTLGRAEAEIKIGVAGPMTGQYSWFGEQMQQGAEMAVADLNAAGGVGGEAVTVVLGDDACDPIQAEAAAQKLVSDGVVFVVGHLCSSSSIPASKIYENAGIIMMSPASTNPKLTDEGGPNVFRLAGRDDDQGVVAATYLAENWGDKKIAFLHDGTTYGKDLADATRAHLNELGVREAMYEAIEPGRAEYADVISRMREAGIEVFYLGGYSTEAALLIRGARDMDYGVQMVSGDALASEEFGLTAGDAADGVFITFFPDAREYPQAEDVVARFREEGFEPAGFTLQTYAVVETWAQAAARAGSLDLDKMIEALNENEYQTVFGSFRFDEKGDMTAPGFVWYVWEDGNYTTAD